MTSSSFLGCSKVINCEQTMELGNHRLVLANNHWSQLLLGNAGTARAWMTTGAEAPVLHKELSRRLCCWTGSGDISGLEPRSRTG